MYKKIIHSAFFIIGLAAIIAVTSVILRPKKDIYDVMAVERKLRDFAGERNDSIDLVFIGDSETYSAYIPLQMYEEYGFTSYVFGTSAKKAGIRCLILYQSTYPLSNTIQGLKHI